MKNIFSKVKYCFRFLPVQVVIVMVLLVIPLNLWGIFTVSKMQEYMYTEVRNSIYSVGQMAMNDLDDRMSSADLFLLSTLPEENAFFGTVLRQEGDNQFYHAVYNLHGSLQSRADMGMDADSYFLYINALDYKDVVFNHAWETSWATVRAGLDSLFGNVSSERHTQRKWELVYYEDQLWLIRCLESNGLYYGALIDVQEVYDSIYNSLGFETVEVLMASDSNSLVANNEKVRNLDTSQQVVTMCDSEISDASLYIYVRKDEIIQSLPLLQRLGVVISLIFCCTLPLIIFFLYRCLIRPVRVLLKAMKDVQSGDFTYQIRARAGSNEFTALYDNFNRMITAQLRLGQEIVEKETYAKKMELQTLQLQIRPHFLLNFLNLLYGLVATKKLESSQKLILYLSDYFRYIFRRGKETELYEKELELIMHYIGVARLRYPFIAFEENHDEDILKVEVPPLLIHNFIENVLKHGLKVKGMTTIRLKAYYEDGEGVFIIEDDGRGMEKSKAEAINEGRFEADDGSVHLGLKNSWQRIRFFYGEKALFRVESEPGKGTKVIVRFPFNIRHEEDER